MVDDPGKVNGKYPIFDNVLAFIFCKISYCPRDTLLSIVQKFYKLETIVKARDVLFEKIPLKDGEPRRVKHRKAEEILQGMYNIFQGLSTEDCPVFVALDLNEIPCVDVSKIDGGTLLHEQNSMKIMLQKLVYEQEKIREHMSTLENRFSRGANDENTTQHNEQAIVPVRTFRDATIARTSAPVEIRRSAQTPTPGSQFRHEITARSTGTRSTVSPNRQSHSRETTRTNNTGSTSREVRRESESSAQEDSEGFTTVTRRRNHRESEGVVGTKSGTTLNAITVRRRVNIFVSRLDPGLSVDSLRAYVEEICEKDFEIIKLKTKFPSYSSFVVTCELSEKDKMMNPENWEEGILVRIFRGQPRTAQDGH